jgi:hypothetical protein
MARRSRRPVDWTFSKCKAFASWVVLPVGAKGNFRGNPVLFDAQTHETFE